MLIRESREKRGMSQDDLAKKLDLNRATISGYESNTKTPSLDVFRRMALLFGVSADYLLGLTEREDIFMDDFDDKQKGAILEVIESIRKGFLEN